ncbi:hypothetical protein JCM10213_008246 [Rhodosporidiobolus nylandii]
MPREGGQRGRQTLFVHLPQSVLSQIFSYAGVLTNKNLALCKVLLPHTLGALFFEVRLLTLWQLAQFGASCAGQLLALDAVRTLHLGTASDWREIPGGGGQLERMVGKRRAGENVPYDPDALLIGVGFVQDLLALLPKLRALRLIGEALVVEVLEQPYLATGALSRVKSLGLCLLAGEDYDADEAAGICRSLALHLPSLEQLCLDGNQGELPCDLLNLSPHVYLPPRSLDVQSLFFRQILAIHEECRTLFSSLTASLDVLDIETIHLYPNFMSDLALLPSSLTDLSLDCGIACPDYLSHRQEFPKLGEIPLFLPNLEHLHLTGDVVSSATFDLLRQLPSLRCLLLAEHTQFSLSQILHAVTLLSSRNISPVSHKPAPILRVRICACPPSSPKFASSRQSSKHYPNWPREFGYSDAKRLIEAAGEAGVELSGTVLCAARSCKKDDGHVCPRWYK